MKNIVCTAVLISSMMAYGQQKEDSVQFAKISTEILNNGKAYTELKDLTQNIGHVSAVQHRMKKQYNGQQQSFGQPARIKSGFRK
ncbi:hypothetical protein [uncultured Chryseobacterium sp.]|uniref:hypothetical protein n=1 Tax=uncultured Chryseobacterium sp. TaxID=259322 RepID=UPI0025E6A3BD|nr:hypothetical protein [uncultured Chryseobacterium sp.]